MNNNRIQHLPEDFAQLLRLEECHINHNQLTTLPSDFGNLLHLRELHCLSPSSFVIIICFYSSIIPSFQWHTTSSARCLPLFLVLQLSSTLIVSHQPFHFSLPFLLKSFTHLWGGVICSSHFSTTQSASNLFASTLNGVSSQPHQISSTSTTTITASSRR